MDLPGRVIVGIRPERVQIGGSKGIVVDATVAAIEPLGAETHVHLEAGGTVLRARAPGFDAPARGEAIRVSLDPRALSWFDAKKGCRIAGSGERALK
jgi:multiple sugar transport system ATP-binding protein